NGVASSVAMSGTLTNEGGGVITAATGAHGAGTLSAATIVNQGTLQSQGGLTLALGTGGLTSYGDVLANGDVHIKAQGSNNYTATIGGALQSGGVLDIQGGSGSTLALTA